MSSYDEYLNRLRKLEEDVKKRQREQQEKSNFLDSRFGDIDL